jgi:hypothetical protein
MRELCHAGRLNLAFLMLACLGLEIQQQPDNRLPNQRLH